MDIPHVITTSNLYHRLEGDPDLLSEVLSLRAVASSLAETISRTVPSFTDHSIRHMDALWGVADRVLTEPEVENLSYGEAFLLTCGFYLHDIGMAYAATAQGLQKIRSSSQYASFTARAAPALRADESFNARALAYAVRTLHASAATELATSPVPGTDIYLFEKHAIRTEWGQTCGRVAASHHWDLEKVERELGYMQVVPLPGNRNGDIGYAASLLRLTDYAHINRDRAYSIERAFRQPMEPESLIHWLAQEHVDGPNRDGADLVYRAAVPISNVDAWWLYYEMLKGLDNEIRTVRRYLDRRTSSHGRLSLQGVRGVTSPEEAAVFVPPAGFLPIEINLRTGSIERLVQLLAGESLYGPDPMAAVRELIQNSHDAVMLKTAIASSTFDRAALSIPIRVALRTTLSVPTLEVTDFGVGMTRKVMTDYLISIASDYWTSQFHTDFPTARLRGFEPAGKFGIGFLSVFMLGDEVTVESNRDGGERCALQLHGVGRRGEIRNNPPQSGSGTAVRVELRSSALESLTGLADLVRVYAPMLSHALEVDSDGQMTPIAAGWLYQLEAQEFYQWILHALGVLMRNRGGRDRMDPDSQWFYFRRHAGVSGGGGSQTIAWPKGWPQFQEDRVRLLASFEGVTLLCLRGLAIQPIVTPGFVGVIDLESAIPNVSRNRAMNADVTNILASATAATTQKIVENLNALHEEGLVIDKLDFVAACVSAYGRQTILDASLPWINLLKLPGDLRLVSCAELRDRLTKSASLFVAYGTGPWTAMRRWVGFDSASIVDEPAIVVDDTPQDRLGYQTGNEEKIGRLSDLWPSCLDAPLFGTILRLSAEAWQTNLDELISQEGWHHSGSVLWGRLSR